MARWLKNLSIANKGYALLAAMAFMIALEIVAIRFAMSTLSGVKVFITVASTWNTAQKDGVASLYRLALTGEESHFSEFQRSMKVPNGFKRGRIAMESCPNINKCPEKMVIIEAGFREGKVPEEELKNLIRVLRRLKGLPYMEGGANLWRRADHLLEDFIVLGGKLHQQVLARAPEQAVRATLAEVDQVDREYAAIQNTFSLQMARGSRALERAIVLILIVALLSVGSVVVYMIHHLAGYFRTNVEEVKNVAVLVGRGDFTQRVHVHSDDEFGEMAKGLNRMIEELQVSVSRRELAESASQVKSLFLANMSHEVRTPLGVILGLIEVLKDTGLSLEARQKYLAVIEQTGRTLQQVIDDILDISKVEAGHLEIYRTKFNLRDFIDELNSNLQLLTRRGKNRLVFQGEGPEMVITDRMRLKQILTNLIGNGLKFTHEGTVTVTYGVFGDNLKFCVQDTGIGISESDQSRLFQAFSQLDRSANRKYGGTGLGLLLSQRLARALDGDIYLESSQPGKGSTFVLDISLKAAVSPIRGKQAPADNLLALHGKNILVVEDSEDNQMLVELFLSKSDVHLDFANNGQEGIDKATTGHYDLVIMDMQMPIVDGYTATEELRRRGYKTPIIALTAHAMKEDRERCLRVGCNDYMTKPINSAAFVQTIASYL